MKKTIGILFFLILSVCAIDWIWRCYSDRYENGIARKDIGNCLKVYPRKIHPLLSVVPFQGFFLISDQENGFSKDAEPEYSQGGFKNLFKLNIGNKIIFEFALINPFLLGDDGFDVAVGDCYATVDVILI